MERVEEHDGITTGQEGTSKDQGCDLNCEAGDDGQFCVWTGDSSDDKETGEPARILPRFFTLQHFNNFSHTRLFIYCMYDFYYVIFYF